jgi:hypothetical protein
MRGFALLRILAAALIASASPRTLGQRRAGPGMGEGGEGAVGAQQLAQRWESLVLATFWNGFDERAEDGVERLQERNSRQ